MKRYRARVLAFARALGWVALAAPVVLSGIAVAPPSGAATPVSLPSSTASADDSWAVLPMGDLSDPDNTFWQVLRATPSSSHWSVVTPQGVADNGGLVAAISGAAIVAGVLPSQLLRFTPLASSSDGGATWDPALLPGALAPRPDALTMGEAGSGDVALVGSSVLRATPSLSSWSRLASLSTLARRDPSCGVQQLDAVAGGPDGEPLVAVACRGAGRVGLLMMSGGTWTVIGPQLRGAWRDATTSVLRLESSEAGTSVLVSVLSGRRQALVALWRSALGHWSVARVQRLTSGESVLASATSAAGGFAVLLGTDGAKSAVMVTPGRPWVPLPAPPAGALSIAAASTPTAGTSYDVFTVKGARLEVFAPTPSSTGWDQVQSTLVPLAYGSSS